MTLEDDFSDILSKAARGRRIGQAALARATGSTEVTARAWLAGREVPDETACARLAELLDLRADALAESAARSWHPGDVHAAGVRHHPQDPHPSNGYVFALEEGRRAALVDPAGIAENLLRILRDGAYALQYILITHKHADHCDATADVARAFPAAKIVMHRADVGAIGDLAKSAVLVRDGEELPFGDGAAIRMLHTPGHTDGSSSYLIRSNVFTGDTLFAGSIGGAYGDLSTYEDLRSNARSKLFSLPDDTVVMPGHGPPTKIGWEKAHNPFFP